MKPLRTFLLALSFLVIGGVSLFLGFRLGYNTGDLFGQAALSSFVLLEEVENLNSLRNRNLAPPDIVERQLDVTLARTIALYTGAQQIDLLGKIETSNFNYDAVRKVVEYRKSYPTLMTGESLAATQKFLRIAEAIDKAQ